MKESDALNKFCPFVREAAHGEFRCAGKKCMMWEAEVDTEKHTIEDAEIKTINDAIALVPKGSRYITGTYGETNGTVLYHSYVPNGSGDCGLKSKELYCEH